MTESFAQLFEESLKKSKPARVLSFVALLLLSTKDVVLVDAGLKSESAIPAEQFKTPV